MKDNEIIKGYCKRKLCPPAQEIIDRQQAENERLKAESQMADGYADALVERAKSEAIKEFERKIKAHAYYIDVPKEHRVVDEDDIDAVLKEMTEQSTGYGSSKTER